MEAIIKVSIVEDIHEIREALCALIGGMPGFSCLGAFETAESAIENIPILMPDVVLMDIQLPKMSGLEALRRLKDMHPEINFLMCTVFEDDDKLFTALRFGANGYILKTNYSPLEILSAIREVHKGGAPMSASIAKRVIGSFHQLHTEKTKITEQLSNRELEVLELLAKGLLYKEVALKLNLSIETIRNHCRHIYDKLHVNSKIEAINLVFGK